MSACSPPADQAKQQWTLSQTNLIESQLSQDGQLLLTSEIGTGATLWDTNQRQPLYIWTHSKKERHHIYIAEISANNAISVTASRQQIAVWDNKTGHNLALWQVSNSLIRDIAVSHNGNVIAYALENGQVVVINRLTNRQLTFTGHQASVNSIAMSADGQFIFSGGSDYLAYFWRTQDGHILSRFVHPHRVVKVALNHNASIAFSADSKGTATLWQPASGKKNVQLQSSQHQPLYTDAVFSNTDPHLLTATTSRNLDIWQVNSGKNLKSLLVTPKAKAKPPSAVIYSARFMAKPRHVQSASSAAIIEDWMY
ncbi:hypothetical protein C2869_19285 [Saccharobesus litoralis]|uniref:Uncharacterized protein n=1 Tax=Saccharobesus litoralis TaxID=2172099 RepID=A0A2S0VW19_9ALTE|nr:hypothetical protein [Saccharobesus litoralis]AWB68417.1 hypothetical protein C2869_19285 [Saccharobesus litoralis]